MKKHFVKTNAVRLLEKRGIAYEIREYEVDESDLSGLHVAESIGLPPAQVFKTLVARGDKTGVLVACIPVDSELDIRELARVSGNKHVDMVPLREVQPLTGYIRGGVSPVGMKKQYSSWLDTSAFAFPFISVSAGVRGCQMLVNPIELEKMISAQEAKLSKKY